jgi:hypothetical protein
MMELWQGGRIVGYARRHDAGKLEYLPAERFSQRFDVHAWVNRAAFERETGVAVADCMFQLGGIAMGPAGEEER